MTLALGLALTSDLLTRPMLATESADQPREDQDRLPREGPS
jgi:hypothetical protein